MTTIRGLEPFGFQGSPPPPSNNNDNDDHRRVHPPTEENTTEDDDAEQEVQEKEERNAESASKNSNDAAEGQTKKQSVASLSGQQQQLAEEASRALSRLQIQSRQSNAEDSSNAIIVSDENRVISSLDDGKRDAMVSAGAAHTDENDATNNSNTQLVCTNNTDSNTTSAHNQQHDVSYGGALTVLPPNELSTTTSDAALAANTFTEMISDGVRRQQQQASVGGSGGGLGGVGLSGGESLCPPGFFVDGSGVVRRSGAGSGAGSYHHHGNNLGGLGGSGYPNSVGARGVGMNEKHRGAMNNGSPGNSGPTGGVGGGGVHPRHHYNMTTGGGGAVSTSTTTTSRPSGDQDPLETDIYHDEEDEDDDEDDDEEEDSSEISASDEDGSWIAWFCGLRGNEFFCEVDEDYIQDDFNLTGLNGLVPYYDYALDMVLDVEMPMEDTLTEEQQEIVESAAEMLYGLIHARYIVTNRGMHAMYEKYRSASFGRCPHVFCQGQPVLPVGLSDLPRNYTVNVFCPRCHGLFFPKSTRQANIDGAYFGTTFPHLYLMNHPVSVACMCNFW